MRAVVRHSKSGGSAVNSVLCVQIPWRCGRPYTIRRAIHHSVGIRQARQFREVAAGSPRRDRRFLRRTSLGAPKDAALAIQASDDCGVCRFCPACSTDWPCVSRRTPQCTSVTIVRYAIRCGTPLRCTHTSVTTQLEQRVSERGSKDTPPRYSAIDRTAAAQGSP
jgi:hypothetical protein